ncbi:hypothetical protein ACFVUQ_34630 [Streptomyces cyaneofuscatus]|uniref:hypothetical protein n=1 Tax=Streptomyces cyaneofuscatus TaxID=66883 RepID=UPI0036D971DF
MTTTSDSFRFSCEERPHGRYTFTLKATDVRLGRPGLPQEGRPVVRLPDTTVANTIC